MSNLTTKEAVMTNHPDVRVVNKPGLGGWCVYDYSHEYHFVRGAFETRQQAEHAAADWIRRKAEQSL
jgi:hypothetical protein